MNKALSESFTNVRKDTGHIFQWLNFLYHQNQYQQRLLEDMQHRFNQITNVPQLSKSDIQRIVEEHYARRRPASQEEVNARIAALESRLEKIQEKRETIIQPQNEQFSVVLEKISELGEKLTELKQKKPIVIEKEPQNRISNLKERFLKKITRNSKMHVKQFILNLIHKYDKASGLQLREMVIDEQGLCSKSSFYRLLQELEDEGHITILSQGKEKLYISKKENIVEK